MLSFTDLAESLSADMRSGGPTARRILDVRDVTNTPAFPPSFLTFIEPVAVEGLSFGAVTIAASGTPVTAVAENADKPTAATVTSKQITLSKFAGMVETSLESTLSAAGLLPSIAYALGGQAFAAFEAAIVAEAKNSNIHEYAAGKYVEGLMQAQGMVLANGGNPSLIAVAAADVAQLGSTMMNAMPDTGVIGQRVWSGARIHVSAGLQPGEAIVMDPAGLTVAVHTDSPQVLLDSTTLAHKNASRVIVDLFGAAHLSLPGYVVPVEPAA